MNGNQKDYLTYSVLGILMQQGRVERVSVARGKTTRVVYRAC